MDDWLKQNWFKLGILIAAFIIAFTVAFSQIYPRLSAKTPSKTTYSNIEKLQLKENCSNIAQKYYEKNWNEVPAGMIVNHTSHFNQKLNKCFIYIKVADFTEAYVSNNYYLYDAIEGGLYAEYDHVVNSGEGKKYEDIPPSECNVEGQLCKSERKFNNLIQPYMEN